MWIFHITSYKKVKKETSITTGYHYYNSWLIQKSVSHKIIVLIKKKKNSKFQTIEAVATLSINIESFLKMETGNITIIIT